MFTADSHDRLERILEQKREASRNLHLVIERLEPQIMTDAYRGEAGPGRPVDRLAEARKWLEQGELVAAQEVLVGVASNWPDADVGGVWRMLFRAADAMRAACEGLAHL